MTSANTEHETTDAEAHLPNRLVHPPWSRKATIYEVNLRQYSRDGNFRSFQSHLPRLRELGANILWFMPIHPIGEKKRKGKLGSYYAVQDYLAVNPEFGTFNEFRQLVNQAHEMGFKVLLDWVANHTAWDCVLTKTHPEWYTRDEHGQFQLSVDDWPDAIDLDYNNPALWDYQIEAMKFWIERCDVDGFRCDVADMVPTEFWNRVRKELDKIKPVFMLAEAETPALHDVAFDMTYNWHLYYLMNDIAAGKKSAVELRNYLQKEQQTFPRDGYRMNFTTNHDENSWHGTVHERLGAAADTFAVLAAMLPGMPLVYSGQEAGLDKRLAFFEKDLIPWRSSEFASLYQQLFRLKRDQEALWNGLDGSEVIPVTTTQPESLFAFLRKKNSSQVLSIFNLSDQPVTTRFAQDQDLFGRYTDPFTGKRHSIEKQVAIELPPWGWRILASSDYREH